MQKKMIATFFVPEDTDVDDVALFLDLRVSKAYGVDIPDATVWDSESDYFADLRDLGQD